MDAIKLTRFRHFVLILALFCSVTAQAQLVDVSWTFGNVGSSSYRLNAFESGNIEFGAIGSQDPTLPLELGRRYQVTVGCAACLLAAHPALDVQNRVCKKRLFAHPTYYTPFRNHRQGNISNSGPGASIYDNPGTVRVGSTGQLGG